METKKVVLAIDDNPVQLKLFEEMLVPRYDLRAVKSASDALHFLNKAGLNSIDIILLDIEMPNVSGFEFLTDIRRIPSCFHVPIIIVSGNTSQEFLVTAKKSEANDVLIKPVTAEKLVESIDKALEAREKK